MEDKKIIENDSQLIVGVNEKISCGKAAFLGMQHVLSMDLYIMPLILGAAIGLAGGELSFFLQMSFFACGIATILQAGFFMKYPIIQGPSYVPLGALCTIGATMGVSAMIGSLSSIWEGSYVFSNSFISFFLSIFPDLLHVDIYFYKIFHKKTRSPDILSEGRVNIRVTTLFCISSYPITGTPRHGLSLS